jgi:hypothetical protein
MNPFSFLSMHFWITVSRDLNEKHDFTYRIFYFGASFLEAELRNLGPISADSSPSHLPLCRVAEVP